MKNDGIFTNAELSAKLIKKYCVLNKEAEELLQLATQKYQLSGRKYHRILKLSRTIADLAESTDIKLEHLSQALQYRVDND